MFAAWSAVAARYAEVTDFVMGHLLERDTGGLHRLHLSPTTTFADLVEQAMAASVARPHAFTLSELVTFAGDVKDGDRHPIFQVAFSTTAHPVAGVTSDVAPCDVVLEFHSAPLSEHHLTLRYRSDRYSSRWAQAILGHVEVLLAAATAAPHTMIDALPMATAEEQRDLRRWSRGPEAPRGSVNAYGMFAEQAARTPSMTALEFYGTSVKYGDLARQAEQLADQLRALGVHDDVRVTISVERSPAMVVALLGVLAAGGTYVPIDPAYPEARRLLMAEDSGALVRLAGPAADGSVIVEQTAAPASDAHANADAAIPVGNGGRLGYVIYTSGSTGKPKGVALTEQALVNLLAWQRDRPGFTPAARTLQFTSMSFDVSFQEIMSTLITGGTIVMIRDSERRDPAALLNFVVEQRVERLFMPFVALRGLAHAAKEHDLVPKLLREVYTAGEQLQVDDDLRALFTAIPDCRLENQYGPSESHVVTASTLPKDRSVWEPLPSIGSPIANTLLAVLSAGGQPQPVGVPGELFIGGDCLARGYLDDVERTNDRFTTMTIPMLSDLPVRMYRSGDVVSWRPDGNVQFHHRVDNQLKFRGYRIELGEVSVVLSNHDDVEQAVAAVRTLPDGGVRLVAFVVAADDLNIRKVHEYAQAHLPAHMVPSLYSVVSVLPLTPSGKVDLDALATPEFDRGLLSGPYERCHDGLEADLLTLWSRALGIKNIGRSDDWFELGGDSLIAVELFSHIKAELDVDLPLGALAANPTIAGLARYFDTNRDAFSVLVPIRTIDQANAKNVGIHKTPFFCVHGGTGNVASFPKLARGLPDDQPFYGLQWDGLRELKGTATLTAMATRYLIDVRSVQPRGPYLFGGQCVGGLIAQEMARQLLSQGQEVALVVMYDSPNMNSAAFVPQSSAEKAKVALYLTKLNGERGVRATLEGLRNAPSPRAKVRALTSAATTKVWRDPAVKPRGFGELVADILVDAVLAHRVTKPVAPTLYFSSGLAAGNKIGLSGTWTDNSLGFAEFAGPTFRIVRAGGGHEHMLYDAVAITAVRDALERFHRGSDPIARPRTLV